MGINDILNIGVRSLSVQRMAIEVTGENISNVNTPGYSRQTMDLQTALGSMLNGGNGVQAAPIQRAHDADLQAQIQGETSLNGEQTVLQNALQKVEPLFNDTASTGIAASIQDFFNSWQDLATNPQGATERQAVLSKGQVLVSDFQRINSSLNEVRQNADKSLTGLTNDITRKAKQIADLNGQITQIELRGGNANQLRDSRDQSLKDLSQKVGVSYREERDGTVTVTLGSTAKYGSSVLVAGAESSLLQVGTTTDGTTGIILKKSAKVGGIDVKPAILADSKGGELGGALKVRDEVIPGFLAKLDELASSLATAVNTQHAAGYDLNNNPGINFFTPPPPATPPAGYSASISLNVTSTNEIAAASLPNGSGNNENALSLAGLKDKTLTVSGTQTTLAGLYVSLVGDVGVAVQSSQQDVAQSGAMLKQLDNLRESTAGVSLDEELSHLIASQKAYEASAKLVNTGLEMLDTIFGMLR